jgi:hypothetical protein
MRHLPICLFLFLASCAAVLQGQPDQKEEQKIVVPGLGEEPKPNDILITGSGLRAPVDWDTFNPDAPPPQKDDAYNEYFVELVNWCWGYARTYTNNKVTDQLPNRCISALEHLANNCPRIRKEIAEEKRKSDNLSNLCFDHKHFIDSFESHRYDLKQ